MKKTTFTRAMQSTIAVLSVFAFYFSNAQAQYPTNTMHDASHSLQQSERNTLQEDQANIQKLQGKVHRVVIIAGSHEWSFRRPMLEADLPAIGCTYEVNDAASIETLISIVAAARAREAVAGASVDARLAAYFYTNEGQRAALVLGRPSRLDDGGVYSYGTYAGMPVALKGSYYDQIRMLVNNRQPVTTSFYCNSE
jgi:hypothetical protein